MWPFGGVSVIGASPADERCDIAIITGCETFLESLKLQSEGTASSALLGAGLPRCTMRVLTVPSSGTRACRLSRQEAHCSNVRNDAVWLDKHSVE